MKICQIFLVLVSAFLLSSCEKWERDDLIQSSQNFGAESQKCYVEKVFPNDCDFLDRKRQQLELNVKQYILNYNVDNRQFREIVREAYKLGELQVEGSSDDSIYSKVYRAYSKTPYYHEREKIFTRGGDGVDLDDVNYAIFTKRCTDYEGQVFYQRYTHFRIIDKSGFESYDVYFNKLDGSCFNIEQLQDDFIILTEKQLERYTNIRSAFGRIVINVFKFDSWDEAKAAVELRRASAQNN